MATPNLDTTSEYNLFSEASLNLLVSATREVKLTDHALRLLRTIRDQGPSKVKNFVSFLSFDARYSPDERAKMARLAGNWFRNTA